MIHHIDPTKSFKNQIDLSGFVFKSGNDYTCNRCFKVLVRLEPGGPLGQELQELDATVILDHHLAEHPVS